MAALRKIRSFLKQGMPWPIVLLTFLLFLPSLSNGYLIYLDDVNYVFYNSNLGFSAEKLARLLTEPVLGLWTPLPMATYLIDYAVGGLTPWIYRLQNILWHLAAVALVWHLLRALAVSRRAAFWIALIFAVHPQRVESVVWIAERKDVVSAVFFFAALNFFLRDRRRKRFFSLPTLLCLLAAMYSKPLGVALSAVMFLLEVFRSRKWNFAFLLKLWPYHLAAALFLFHVSQTAGQISGPLVFGSEPVAVLTLMLRNYFSYAGKIFLPLELLPVYPFFFQTPGNTIAWLLLAAAALGGLGVLRRKKPKFFYYRLLPCLLIFGGLLLPVSGLQVFSNADFADRYSYIPSVFLLIPAAWLLRRQKILRPALLRLGLTAYVICLMLFNLHYQAVWRNDTTLFQAACDTGRPNYRAAAVLAWLYLENGLEDEAVTTIRRSAGGSLLAQHHATMIAVHTDFITGLAARQRGKPEAAYFYLNRLERSSQRRAIGLFNRLAYRKMMLTLARLELDRGNWDRAVHCYEDLADFFADVPVRHAYYSGAAALLRQDFPRAIACFETVLSIDPEHPEALKNLAAARKFQEAQMKEDTHGNP